MLFLSDKIEVKKTSISYILLFIFSKICSNGYITIDKRMTSVRPNLRDGYPVIAPYNLDLIGDRILYRKTTRRNEMTIINDDVRRLIGTSRTSFYANEAIIVTFNNVPGYRNRNNSFKFQVVIATDYTDTYAIFNYGRVDNQANLIGFNDPSCCLEKVLKSSNINRRSNVGITGKHVFKLSDCNSSKTPSIHFSLLFLNHIYILSGI